MKPLLLFLFLLLPSCGIAKVFDTIDTFGRVMEDNRTNGKELIDRVTKVAGDISKVTTDISGKYDETVNVVKEKITEVKETISKMDQDGDGNVSLTEMLLGLLGLGGLGGGAVAARNAKSAKEKQEKFATLEQALNAKDVKMNELQKELAVLSVKVNPNKELLNG